MIKKLFSDKFLEVFGETLKKNIGDILGLNKVKIIFYPWSARGWRDIREVFSQSAEEDNTLIEYYQDYWDEDAELWDNALSLADAVNQRITYQNDQDAWGRFEHWAKPIEVHDKQFDDCDGYAVLLCYLLRLFGASDYETFVRVGRVKRMDGTKGEYHANVILLDWDSMLYFPLEGSWYPTEALDWFEKKKQPLIDGHPLYFETDWIANDELSFANTRWFKFIR